VRPLSLASLTVTVLSLTSLPVNAETIRVPGDQPTIQAGIDAASYGDTVVVACGTYYEHDIAMKSGVCLTSETGQADCVTINAQFDGRVIHCADVDQSSSIEGLTMVAGYGSQGSGAVGGGGIFFERSSPRVTNCTLLHNDGLNGGGMWLVDGSNPTVTNCQFIENSASGGGGVAISSSSPTFTDCLFAGNSVFGGGGGMVCTGYSAPIVVRCTFSENHNYIDEGSGILCYSSFPALTDCIIAFNSPGVAVHCSGSALVMLTCCDIYGNAGGDWVGCIADQYGVDGNFSADPRFCMSANSDEPYSLQEDSPCRGIYSPCGRVVGAFGVGCPATSPVEDTSWGAIKSMYR
jgi:hypothetical protein